MNTRLRRVFLVIFMGLMECAFGGSATVLSANQFEVLRNQARLALAQLPGDVPAATVDNAAETPAGFEALADAWMDQRIASRHLTPQDRSVLQRWSRHAPAVWIEHHEFPVHTMPAFAIAARARALLEFDEIRRRADQLLADPKRFKGLPELGALDQVTLRAAGLALAEISEDALQRLTQAWSRAGSDAHALRLALARHQPGDRALWQALVRDAPLPIARQALAMAMELELDHLGQLAEQALQRPKIGGVALSAWLAAGGNPDQRCWELLADPDLGADAALALARGSRALEDQIRFRFADAPLQARLRMRLALRLRDTTQADRLLQQLGNPELAEPRQ